MKKTILYALVALITTFRSFAQDIYTYTFASTAGIPSYTDPLLAVASPLTPVGTAFITPCTWGFSGICGFTGGSYTPAGPCVEITLTAIPGYTIDVTRFYAYLRRSGTGPVAARLAYSTNGVTWTDDGIDHNPTNGSCATSLAMTTLANWTFTVTNPTLYFRIYPFGASSGSGTIQVYDLHIEGLVHPLCTNPIVTVSPSGGSFCSGGAGSVLTATGAGIGGTYKWTPAAGLSATTGATITAIPTSTTTYSVIGTTTLGCSDTTPVVVTVLALPTATLSTSGPTSICPGDSVVLTAGSGPGYSYRWHNGVSYIPGATKISYTAKTGGNYTVQVTNPAGCIATAPIQTVIINTPPVATITATTPLVFCDGGNVTLNATTGAGYTYQWSKFGTPLAGATTATYISDTTGIYTVQVSGPAGCKSTSAATIAIVVPQPFIKQKDTAFCAGNPVRLGMNVSGMMGLSYQWQLNGVNLPGATDLYYNAGNSGKYNCTVSVPGSCVYSTPPVTFTVYPVKVPWVSFSGSVFSTTKDYVSYQWYMSGIGIKGATSSAFSPSTYGTYRVRATDSNGCSSYSNAYVIYTLGLEEHNRMAANIYPNPATTVIHIECATHVKAVITAMDGRIILEQPGAADIEINSLSNGLYMISLYDENGQRIMVQKLIKE